MPRNWDLWAVFVGMVALMCLAIWAEFAEARACRERGLEYMCADVGETWIFQPDGTFVYTTHEECACAKRVTPPP